MRIFFAAPLAHPYPYFYLCLDMYELFWYVQVLLAIVANKARANMNLSNSLSISYLDKNAFELPAYTIAKKIS